MSKSTGNVIDPLEMSDKYGTDALRFTLTAFAAMGRDIKLSESRIEGYRHFVNKIWNSARFALMNFDGKKPEASIDDATGLANKWILHRLEEVKVSMREGIEGYRFNEVAQTMYKFIWNEFCDWYLEMIKPDLYSEDESRKAPTLKVLWTVLSETMILLHPVMPFVTQEIWSVLPGIENEDIATVLYPETRADCISADAVSQMELFQGIVSGVRNIRTELLIAPSKKLEMIMRTSSDEALSLINDNSELVKFLARLETVEAGPDVRGPEASGTAVVQGNEIFIPLAGAV